MEQNEILAVALAIGRVIERELWPCSLVVATARAEEELTRRGVAGEYRRVVRVLALRSVIAGR